MILVLDVGNTNVTVGVFDGDELRAHWRLATQHDITGDQLALSVLQMLALKDCAPESIRGVSVSCVVPPLLDPIGHMCREYFHQDPLVVGPGIKTGIAIDYEDPREVGADRIVNGLAAHQEFGGPVIVADFGTATTLDVVSADAHYLGGAIAPGIEISLNALFHQAAQLRRVELVKPRRAIGRNTVWSMQSGVVFGYCGLVRELIRRFREELECEAQVVATGGLAALIAGEIEEITAVDPWLTLKGLRLVWERNR